MLSWRPAVPPPPVSGAVVGYAGATGAAVCVTGAEDGTVDGAVVAGGFDEAGADTCGEPVLACGEPVLACAVGDVLAPAVLVDVPPSVGDGARLPEWPAEDPCPLVCGVGVKTDGTDEPPPVQADTANARSTAPAAERPAISHAPWAALGLVRRIFMNPPRMRVR
jgi:hypothetical protein